MMPHKWHVLNLYLSLSEDYMTLVSIQRARQEIDAAGQPVGRIATQVAMMLRGKNKASFTPNIDAGDFVTVTNVAQLRFTGKKLVQKDYYHHTQHPGGIKRTPMKKVFDAKPEEVLYRAVWGMLPKNSLGRQMLTKLKVYPGKTHPHQAQQPKTIEL